MKAINKDSQKFLESDSLDVMITESDRVRKEQMQNMPESVRELVQVIVNTVDEPTRNKSDNRLARLLSRKIADALSNLSDVEASTLNTMILSTIRESKSLGYDVQKTKKTRFVWVTFMVNPYSTKEYQRSKIVPEIDRLKKKRGTQKIPLVVFSMNPDKDGVSFEIGFWID